MKTQRRTGSRLLMGLVFLFLYAPIFLLIIFSFNSGESSTVWQGFSLDWYVKLFQNRIIMESVYTTLLVSLLEAARDLGASSVTVFRRVIFPLSLPGILSGVTMVFVPSVSTFAISRLLGGGTQMMLGDLIEQQFLGGAYNPHLGAAISMVMMVIVVVCMVVMNHFGEGEEQAVML